MKKILLLLTICAFVFSTSAQDSKGDDFWIMFPANLENNSLPLYITSDVNTSGTVDIPGSALVIPYEVTAGVITTVTIPTITEVTTSDIITNKGIHITALNDITVYGFSERTASTDAMLAFPSDALGKEYIILTYKNVDIVNGTQFGIVAAESGTTTVTITPSVTTGPRLAGVPYSVVLTQGQTYMLRHTLNTGDLTGTIVSADKNIAVFGSHQCANIPNGSTFACDYLVEQLPPTSAWGTKFVSVPLKGRIGGDTYRVLAQAPETVVKVDGSTVATLNTGEYYESLLPGYNEITGSNPILVGQYSNGTTFDGVTSDPFFLLLPPTDQYLTSYIVNSGTPNIPINHINIVSLTSDTGSVLVDGVSVDPAAWTIIPGTAYSGAQVTVSVGQHSVSSTLPIGVFIYGFGDADSYGYLGGQSFSPVATVDKLNLNLTNTTSIQAQEKCAIATVLDQNNDPVVDVLVNFTVTGANTAVGFGNTDVNGQVTLCYDTCLAGTDVLTATIAGLSDETIIEVAPSTLTVNPTVLNSTPGVESCVSATVIDGESNPVPDAQITFTVTGSNPASETMLPTDADGHVQFCYTPANTGEDVITITAGCVSGNSETVNVNINLCTDITVDAGADQTVYFGYLPTECVTLTATAIGGATPYSYLWSTGETSQSIIVCPTTTSTYSVDVVDDNGCTGNTDEVMVEVVDVRSGKNLDKVSVCHVPSGNPERARTLSLNTDDVPEHLSHGDYLGECSGSLDSQNKGLILRVFPNPAADVIQVSSETINLLNGKLVIRDLMGSEWLNLTLTGSNGFTSNVSNMKPGMYLVIVSSAEGTFYQRLIIK